MRVSDLKVGTVYLVHESNDWRERTYGAKAYRLVSLDRFSSKTHYRSRATEVTFDGQAYSIHGRAWANKGFDGEVKYAMIRVHPETREVVAHQVDGRPFLALVAAREIRGEWAEALADAVSVRKAESDRRTKRINAATETRLRMNRAISRFKVLLGIENERYTSRVQGDTLHNDGVTWGNGVTLVTKDAEAVLDRLEAAEARVIELETLLRDGYGHHFPAKTLRVEVYDRHDYEPGDVTHPMHTDPSCAICGAPKH